MQPMRNNKTGRQTNNQNIYNHTNQDIDVPEWTVINPVNEVFANTFDYYN